MIVDGVGYTPAKIRELVRERHRLADDVRRLRARLEQNDSHLRYRTAALVRMIAKKGPRLS